MTSCIDFFCRYFVPLLNPDGYEFTFTDDRLWRKNRAPPMEEGNAIFLNFKLGGCRIATEEMQNCGGRSNKIYRRN